LDIAVKNALLLSFANSLYFHYKRHNQNKAASTVNKNQDFLNLLVQSGSMSKQRFMLRWCLVCLVSFAVAMRIVSQSMSCVTIFAIDSLLSFVAERMLKENSFQSM